VAERLQYRLQKQISINAKAGDDHMSLEAITATDSSTAYSSPATSIANRPSNYPRVHRATNPYLVRAARRAGSPTKRAMDIVVSTLVLTFLSPALVSFALAIWLSAPNASPLIGSERAGRYAKPFKCLKFRTLSHGSDEPTMIGAFLKATGLEHLPQMFNVLLGDMSLVGPKPLSKAKLDEGYGKNRCYYLLLRPGVTGLWQAASHDKLTAARLVALDQKYLYEWSLIGDVAILLNSNWISASGRECEF
jgi:lipopolysaccharide/colanic/teichoic acid biosynthesis glycosyltransferase